MDQREVQDVDGLHKWSIAILPRIYSTSHEDETTHLTIDPTKIIIGELINQMLSCDQISRWVSYINVDDNDVSDVNDDDDAVIVHR